MKYFFTIILLLFAIVIIYYFTYYKKESFHSPNIVFMTKSETQKYISEDSDKYIYGLSNIDLYARNVSSSKEYIWNVAKCCKDFTNKEKEKLIRCCKKADDFLNNYNYHNLKCSDIAIIKWKFALTKNTNGYEYEQGFPHTRSDIIFLSNKNINNQISGDTDDDDLVSTLIHEKVHIYQRQNPKKMVKLLEDLGYKKINIIVSNKRSNPDTDDSIYINPENQKPMYLSYNNNSPENINDVSGTDHTLEHPYEKMAYDIARKYIINNLNIYKNI